MPKVIYPVVFEPRLQNPCSLLSTFRLPLALQCLQGLETQGKQQIYVSLFRLTFRPIALNVPEKVSEG